MFLLQHTTTLGLFIMLCFKLIIIKGMVTLKRQCFIHSNCEWIKIFLKCDD